MLDSLAPVLEHWYIFLPLLAAIALLYFLERKLKKGKVLLNLANVLIHIALFVLCFVFNTGIETALMLLLAAVLIGMVV